MVEYWSTNLSPLLSRLAHAGTFYCELHSEHLGPENGFEDSSDEVGPAGERIIAAFSD